MIILFIVLNKLKTIETHFRGEERNLSAVFNNTESQRGYQEFIFNSYTTKHSFHKSVFESQMPLQSYSTTTPLEDVAPM